MPRSADVRVEAVRDWLEGGKTMADLFVVEAAEETRQQLGGYKRMKDEPRFKLPSPGAAGKFK